MVGGDGDCHHPVEGEVEQGEVHKEEVPEELDEGPLESDHGIHDDAVDERLDKKVREFHHSLSEGVR